MCELHSPHQHLPKQPTQQYMTEYVYSNACIYAIECLNTGEVYIGLTVQPLDQRMNVHRHGANQYNRWVADGSIGKCPSNGRCCSIQILNRGNYESFPIESFPCNTLPELHLREGCVQLQHKKEIGEFCINKQIAGAYARVGKVEYAKQYDIQYRKNNKEKFSESSVCPVCNGRYTYKNKSGHLRTKMHLRAIQTHTCPPPVVK